MKFHLTDQQIRQIAREAGVAPDSLRRASRSITVVWPEELPQGELSPAEALTHGEGSPAGKQFQIGLRLQDLDPAEMIGGPGVAAVLSDIVREYRNCCPAVFNWLSSGGFQPNKIPDTVNRAGLLHASRTAGRLRAKLARKSAGR